MVFIIPPYDIQYLIKHIPTPESSLFFFNDTATTEIYTLSLHDALPICHDDRNARGASVFDRLDGLRHHAIIGSEDRKSTRLNSSHSQISYAVFCLKKKKSRG